MLSWVLLNRWAPPGQCLLNASTCILLVGSEALGHSGFRRLLFRDFVGNRWTLHDNASGNHKSIDRSSFAPCPAQSGKAHWVSPTFLSSSWFLVAGLRVNLFSCANASRSYSSYSYL